MDTYENDELKQNPQPLEEEVAAEPEVSEGLYHGNGVGNTETITPVQEPVSQPEETTPQEETASPKPKKKKGHWRRLVAAAVVLALVIAGCGVVVGTVNSYWKYQNNLLLKHYQSCLDVMQEQLDQSKNNSSSVVITTTAEAMTPSQIYNKNIAAVVAVNCTVTTVSGNQTYQGVAAGSGFVLTEDGYIVTNHHVIDGAETISVTFEDGTEMEATLIGSDSTNDVALIKIDANGLQCVKVGSSDELAVGEQVVAIGNALGELSFSLTVGYVSGIDRSVSTDGTVINMIQTDAAINSGNSGGPLFNSRGQVVGITTAKYSGTTSSGASIEGIGFAIPMNDVVSLLDDLREYGYVRTSYMGITCRTVETTYGDQLGVRIEGLERGACAAKAGLKVSDIITNLGGYSINNTTDLSNALRNIEPGTETTVSVLRGGQIVILEITLDEKPHN